MACGLAITPVLAVPNLPSSFYGQVKINGQNVPEGTLVRALIGGREYATARAMLYDGNSVFSLNVVGDESDTSSIEGGKEGDTIHFEVGGVIADQIGVWHSGTNVSLDLSASASGPLATPPPVPTAVPTQTAIPSGKAPETPAGDSGSAWLVTGIGAAAAVLGGAAWLLRKKHA